MGTILYLEKVNLHQFTLVCMPTKNIISKTRQSLDSYSVLPAERREFTKLNLKDLKNYQNQAVYILHKGK